MNETKIISWKICRDIFLGGSKKKCEMFLDIAIYRQTQITWKEVNDS